MSSRVLVVLLVCGVASVAFAQSGGQPEDAEAHANALSSSDARDAEVFGESSSGIPADDARDAENERKPGRYEEQTGGRSKTVERLKG